MARTDQDDIALPAGDERNTPQDERPHENLTQLGVSGDERPQRIPGDLKKLPADGDATKHQAALPRDHRHLAGEPTGAVRGYLAFTLEIRLYDLHAARKQNEKWDLSIVGLKQDL